MAGHSKFKNIMHRKGAQDAKRAKYFTKLGREIVVATKIGGPDPDSNPRLRLAIQAARGQNMPKDNIERAIKKGSGPGDGENYEEIRYEGYGPGAVALIVETLTDNRNRTAADVRSTFSKHGGNLGETGSVSFGFDRMGRIAFPLKVASADAFFEAALESGAADVESQSIDPDDDDFEPLHAAFCSPEDFAEVKEALEARFGEAKEAKLIWKPQNMVEVEFDKAQTLLKLIDVLEDHDDVQSVTGNFEFSDAVAEQLAAA